MNFKRGFQNAMKKKREEQALIKKLDHTELFKMLDEKKKKKTNINDVPF